MFYDTPNEVWSCFGRCEFAPVCASACVCVSMCTCVLGTCDILRIHSLPLGRESAVCEATVGLEGDRYCVAGTDDHGGKDVATVCA